ncbi:MAG: hypothetical protein ACREJG_02380 [Candidatus Rokuibacteriota bacterium]
MRLVRLVVAAALLSPVPATALERVPAVLHVHSTLSTGELSLEQLGALAEQRGVGALLLAENYLLRIEYGLPPFRALTRVTREEPSILTLGAGAYLARVEEARRAFPRLVIVPGVEVIPHYRWAGSPLSLGMTVTGTQKNLLVFGVSDAGALRGLPATGNPHLARHDWRSLVEALPILLLAPGLVLVAKGRRRRVRLGVGFVAVRRRSWLAGSLLCLVGLATLVRGWPFSVERYPPYEDLGLAVHQELIDHVDRLGGVTVWSFPEARDSGRQRVGPVAVEWETPPYPDDLHRSFRYTAFGGIYEDTTRFERPGEGWDRVLRQYVAGERSRPAWAVGEAGFHDFTAGKRFGNVQTVFLARQRSEAAVLEAMRHGRLYALHRAPRLALELREFAVAAGEAVAVSGESLVVARGAVVETRVAVDASDGGRHDIRVALVRNGILVEAWAGATPLRAVHREVFDGHPAYVRVEVRAATPHRLLTNPIFIRTSP